MLYQPKRLLRLTLWSGQDKSLSIPTNIWIYGVTKAGCRPGNRPMLVPKEDAVPFGHNFRFVVTAR